MNVTCFRWLFCIGLGFFSEISNAQHVEYLHQYGTKAQSEVIASTTTNSSGYIVSLFRNWYDTNSNPVDTLFLGDSSYYFPQIKDLIIPNYLIQNDREGNLVRSKYIGTFQTSILVTDEDDNIYVFGDISKRLNIVGDDTLDYYKGTMILAKYDKYLNELWHVQNGEDSASGAIYKAKWCNGHLYYFMNIIADATIGNVAYKFNKFYYTIFGEIDSDNGNYLWSKAMPERTHGLGGIFLTDIVRLSNSNIYLSGQTAFEDFIINGDSFNRFSGFVIKTDSIGNYKKRYLLIGKSAQVSNNLGISNVISSLTSNNSNLFLSCSISDDFIWKGGWVMKQIDTVGQEGILIALNPELDEYYYYRPTRKSKSKSTYDYSYFNVYYSNGFLYGIGSSTYFLQLDSFIFKDIPDSSSFYFGGRFLFKLDTLGNFLWAVNVKKGQKMGAFYRRNFNPYYYYLFYNFGYGFGSGSYNYWFDGPAIMNGKNEIFFSGWFEDSVTYGNYKKFSKGGFDGYLTKVSENEIHRQYLKNADYCAGDTFVIPFTTKGIFDSINYFVAELSNEYGDFGKDARFLGAVKTFKDSSIRAILPLKNLTSSHNYRIRIRSTWPAVENDYKNDTLRFTIYSKDKAFAGNDTTICPSDSARLYALGGTSVTWLPNIGLRSNNARLSMASPAVTTRYLAIIDDSSGCSVRDSAFKIVYVKPAKIILSSRDTIICVDDTFPITARFEGADTTTFSWKWWLIEFGYYNLIQTGSKKSMDRLNFSFDQGYNVKIGITLDDGCPRNNYDTLEIKVSMPTELKVSAKDIISCINEPLKLTAAGAGGIKPRYKFHWEELSPSKIIGTGDSVPFATDKKTTLMVRLSDGCMEREDTQYVQINIRKPLQASSNLRDSTLCFGQHTSYTAQGTGGDTANYQYRWILNGKKIGTGKTFNFATETHFSDTGGQKTLQLILADNCTTKNDTISAAIRVRPKLRAQLQYDSVFCFGKTKTLKARGTGGTGMYQFAWYDPNGKPISTADSITINHNDKAIKGQRSYALTLSDGCSAPRDSQILKLNFLSPLTARISSTDSCLKANTTLTATATGGDGNYTYLWYQNQLLQGQSKTLNVPLPTQETSYLLVVNDACPSDSAKATQEVSPYPQVIFSSDKDSGCELLKVNFNAKRQNATTNEYRYTMAGASTNWRTDSSYSYNFTAGKYTPQVEVKTKLGCRDTAFSNPILVHPKPQSKYTYTPNKPTPQSPEIQFVNSSTGATQFNWNFGKFGNSTATNPKVNIPESGVHIVSLIAINQFGCSDTNTGTIRIYDDYQLWLPNAFTPGLDNLNPVFKPEFTGVDSYTLYIYNRHGLLIFIGENQGWDGMYKNNKVPEGMYVYTLKITTANYDKVQEQGVVMLLRGE